MKKERTGNEVPQEGGAKKAPAQTAWVKTAWKNCRDRVKSVVLNRDPAVWLVLLLAVSFFAYLIYSLVKGPDAFTDLYFRNGKDMFMDYFNSVRDVGQGVGVYTERHVIYPPMANLVFLIFMRWLPQEYVQTEFVDRQTWGLYPSALLSLLLFMVIPILLISLLCRGKAERNSPARTFLGFFALFNVPMLYLFERGNILIYTVLGVCVYFFFYDGEKKWERELSLIGLAFAFSLKLYPAILGLPLLADKRWKDAVRCALYGVILTVIPSLFFGGPQCILWMLQNIRSFSSNSLDPDPVVAFIQTFAFWGSFALFIPACFVQKDRTKLWIFGVGVLRAYPALSSLYAWTLFLAPLIIFCNKKRKLDRYNWMYWLCVVMPFLFLPFFNAEKYRGFSVTVLYALLLLCCVDTVVAIRADFIRRRRKAEGEFPQEELEIDQ